MIRVDSDSLFIFRYRSINLALFLIRGSQVNMSVGIIRVDSDSLFKFLYRSIKLAQFSVRNSQIIMGVGMTANRFYYGLTFTPMFVQWQQRKGSVKAPLFVCRSV